jgi:hypothetical protein
LITNNTFAEEIKEELMRLKYNGMILIMGEFLDQITEDK